MKKVLLALVVLATGVAANAQKVNFGVKGGYNLSMVNVSGGNVDLNALSTFHLGGLVNLPLKNNLSLQPQLLLSGKGTKQKDGEHYDNFSFLSIDIPVNLVYSFKNGLFLGAGPNIGVALSGKEGHNKQKSNFGTNAGEWNRLEFGANALVGYKLKNKLFFSANYTAGLSDWDNYSSTKWRNSVLGVSVGYFFN
ncbi:MAG TPA: hypothetical protein DCL43_10070 [Chitinophagaceae bacterium]|nr:hypothetical protein [Chitinophagaceae bacterium]HAN39465.1 hypothetical protein [Chitinophagaceae bacterium]